MRRVVDKMRDDFTKSTKEKLAKRVGYHCSNCGKLTSGPGEASDGVSMIGVAAHICAASKGGPRYEDSMTPSERSSIENGIWLCQNCAHLIDTNEELYTVQMLKDMKSKAETKAQHQISSNYAHIDLPRLSDGAKNQIIAASRVMKDGGEYLRNQYGRYQAAVSEAVDINIYNVCVGIYNACLELNYLESQNHIQLKGLGLDTKLLELQKLLPAFYDASNDLTGVQMVATNFDYVKFFGSDDGKRFIKKCKRLVEDVEKS